MVLEEIVFSEFPTHIPLTKTKSFKISTQSIYNAKLHHHSRSSVISKMKEYVTTILVSSRRNIYVKNEMFPIKIELTFFAPVNWGSVRMSKGVINWKTPPKNYHPTHDLDNFAWIWSKVIQDCLVSSGIIPEDTVEFINVLEYRYEEVPTFKDRKIQLRIIKSV